MPTGRLEGERGSQMSGRSGTGQERSKIARLPPDSLTDEQRRLYQEILNGPRATDPAFPMTTSDGCLVGPYGVMLLSPEVGRAVAALGAACRFNHTLSAQQVEIVILTVSTYRGSEFIRYAHERVSARIGLANELVARLRHLDEALADPSDEAVRALALQLLRREDVPDASFADLVSVIGAPAMMEISTIVGYYSLLADQLTLFRVSVPEERHA